MSIVLKALVATGALTALYAAAPDTLDPLIDQMAESAALSQRPWQESHLLGIPEARPGALYGSEDERERQALAAERRAQRWWRNLSQDNVSHWMDEVIATIPELRPEVFAYTPDEAPHRRADETSVAYNQRILSVVPELRPDALFGNTHADDQVYNRAFENRRIALQALQTSSADQQ